MLAGRLQAIDADMRCGNAAVARGGQLRNGVAMRAAMGCAPSLQRNRKSCVRCETLQWALNVQIST